MSTLRICFLATTLFSIVSIQAQGTRPKEDVALVSRMCLWNADKAMWFRVGLRKDQIRKMKVLRERYPAVVEGQWIMSDTLDQVSGTAAATAPNPAGADQPLPGLQAEVRAVLTPRQVNRWMALCMGVATR